jgi:cyclophilin family peptidyl-prolyl cis-trans isomerase
MRRLLTALAVLGMTAGMASAANPIVVMKTSMGTVKIELFADKAPKTVENFLKYVDDKFYDNTIFHRVIGKPGSKEDFMIQGGGFEKDMKQKDTRDAIKNESDNGLSNKKYTLAMARTDKPDSATAQFYINIADNDFLDKANARDKVGYCVFGRVIDGMDVVEKIRKVKTGAKGQFNEDCPQEDVVIKSVKRAEAPK